jgi:hypothetical protein
MNLPGGSQPVKRFAIQPGSPGTGRQGRQDAFQQERSEDRQPDLGPAPGSASPVL